MCISWAMRRVLWQQPSNRNTSNSRSLRVPIRESTTGHPSETFSAIMVFTSVLEAALSVEHRADGRQHLGGCVPLNDVASRAGAEGSLDIIRFFVHGKHDHRGFRRTDLEVLDEINAGGISQGKVHNRHARFRGRNGLHCLGSGGGFAAHGQVGLLVDQGGQPLADQRMVIQDENRSFQALGCGTVFLASSAPPRNTIFSAGTTRSSMIGPTSMPPTITVASGRCTWLPMPVEIAAGKQADARGEAGHQQRPHPGRGRHATWRPWASIRAAAPGCNR